MYIPSQFAEDRPEVLHQLIHAHPLGALVTLSQEGLNANHIPFELIPASADAPFGILRAHVARSNPMWNTADSATEALVIFQGPQFYISPNWYEEKQATGKVVPTYNYAVVHAHGPLRIVDDAAWLLALLQRLTARHESSQARPWEVTDAPADYIEKLLGAIIGIEIPVMRLEGKWKVSQNRPAADRARVIEGLNEVGNENALAMAKLVGGER